MLESTKKFLLPTFTICTTGTASASTLFAKICKAKLCCFEWVLR